MEVLNRIRQRESSDRRKVLVVDDHSSVRMALRMVIVDEPDMVVCGEAEDVRPALEAAERLSPDIVITDIALKQSHGIELIRDLSIRYPRLPILVHSVHCEELFAPVCFHNGAHGYMNKGEDVKTIVHAIRTVMNGGRYVSARVLRWFTDSTFQRDTNTVRHPLHSLSSRELQIFEMIGRGLDMKEIASQLSLDHKTVEQYRQRIKAKIGVQTAPQVVRAAVLWSQTPMKLIDLIPS